MRGNHSTPGGLEGDGASNGGGTLTGDSNLGNGNRFDKERFGRIDALQESATIKETRLTRKEQTCD